MNTDIFLDLSLVHVESRPFPHLSSPAAFQKDFEPKVLEWLENTPNWNITETDFYEQHEFDLLKATIPGHMECLVSKDLIACIENKLKHSFQLESLSLVGIVAHKLVNGQKIGIHNDFINGDETHRMVIHLNHGWKEDNGGVLMLFGSSNANDVSKITYPLNNYAFGFEISPKSHHAVSKIYNFSRYSLIYTFRDPVINLIAGNIDKFIDNPLDFQDMELIHLLVTKKDRELKLLYPGKAFKYSTAVCINGISDTAVNVYALQNNMSFLETASLNKLQDFYDEHGLNPVTGEDLPVHDALQKLNRAMAIIGKVPVLDQCICYLVKRIQVLKTSDPETDISYSHPKIPFSIFVSTCQDDSVIADLRVAESVIHEAMHLKLTLIENELPLAKQATDNLFFSPWRKEKRPAQGVLHGLFVFRIILDFYDKITGDFQDTKIIGYINDRKNQIVHELKQLNDFVLCQDLTSGGEILTKNLLVFHHQQE